MHPDDTSSSSGCSSDSEDGQNNYDRFPKHQRRAMRQCKHKHHGHGHGHGHDHGHDHDHKENDNPGAAGKSAFDG